MSEAISPRFVSYVAKVGEHGSPGPVDVVFAGHSAIFNLERDQPCFPSWLDMLKRSAKDTSPVVFTFNAVGSRITSLESGSKISGVVESIPRGVYRGACFKLVDYADMFFLPATHPELADWLMLLHRSLKDQLKIVFAYDAFNRRVRSLTRARE